MIKQSYFYPLIEEFDRDFLRDLNKVIEGGSRFVGDKEDKLFFAKSLLIFQMLDDYRAPLVAIKNNLGAEIKLDVINQELRSKNFVVDYSWAVWTHEKIMGDLAEKLLANKSVRMIGNAEEFDEFVLRYLVSIWLAAWEGPLYALLQSTKSGVLDLKEMNEILRKWDFTDIFSKY